LALLIAASDPSSHPPFVLVGGLVSFSLGGSRAVVKPRWTRGAPRELHDPGSRLFARMV